MLLKWMLNTGSDGVGSINLILGRLLWRGPADINIKLRIPRTKRGKGIY
jgi:hypothetical protein